MKIERLRLDAIQPSPYNPRKISEENLARLEGLIREHELVEPLVVNSRTSRIVGGHQRYKVLRKMGVLEAECVIVDLPESREKALNIALNNPSAQGEYEFSKLADLLQEIDTGEFDIEALTAFPEDELKRIAEWVPPLEKDETEAVPEPPENPVSQTGDLWQMGKHRLLCGDSTKAEDVVRFMGDERARLMNTDPPYGINYGDIANSRASAADVRKGGDGKNYATHDDKEIENDDLDGGALQDFLERCIRAALPCLIENPAFYLWHPMLTQGTFFAAAAAAAAADILIHRQIIWVKPSLIMGRGDYHWRHELCFYGWIRGKRCAWLKGRDQDTVWEVGRENDKIHPTQKPVKLFEIPMENHTQQGDVVYEPFSGSGSQIIAAEKLGRRCYAIEIAEKYCDVSIRRWENFTGQKAILKSTGETFDDVARARGVSRMNDTHSQHPFPSSDARSKGKS